MERFTNFMSKRYETMKFVMDMVKAHSYRKAAVLHFLNRIPNEGKKKIYLSEGERLVIERFMRNYIRYNKRWRFRVKLPQEMEIYVDKFHFKKTPGALAYYTFNKKREKEKLVEVLEKFR